MEIQILGAHNLETPDSKLVSLLIYNDEVWVETIMDGAELSGFVVERPYAIRITPLVHYHYY